MPNDRGATITLRLQRLGAQRLVKTLDEAGYLPTQIEILERVVTGKGGLTTLCGTVGSGKTVTLAILMELMHSRRPDIKGISFEDPVEIETWMDQRTITRDLYAKDDEAFRTAVVSLFRSALDVFLLGEVRDVDAGRTLRAVLDSGHSCFTTTHAADCLTGIISTYPSAQVGIPASLLATPGMLKLNVYQSLLLKNCAHCSLTHEQHRATLITDAQRSAFAKLLDDIELVCPGVQRETLRFHNPLGCEHCRRDGLDSLRGFAGRTVIAEMVEPDERMCELILKENMPELRRYWRGLSDGNIASPHFEGKTAMEVAMHKASLGLIDPYEIEKEFDAFATMAAKAKTQQRLAPRSNIAWARSGLGVSPAAPQAAMDRSAT
jgi:type II secretory ATPase GspE/PulE/Tfp pilus assembly ATPase PilB-like protein